MEGSTHLLMNVSIFISNVPDVGCMKCGEELPKSVCNAHNFLNQFIQTFRILTIVHLLVLGLLKIYINFF